MRIHRSKRVAASVLGLMLVAAVPCLCAAPVGEVVVARGATTMQTPSGESRIVGRGDRVEEGALLSTSSKSFAIVEFDDETRMVLRPGTVFTVEQWNSRPNEESAVLRLFQGGLRAVTGFLTKRNSNAFRVNTPVATIGIRGTTFDAWLCDPECTQSAAKAGGRRSGESQVVGRVGFLRGDVQVRRGEELRPLERRFPLYAGDRIETGAGSAAILVFRDETRMTVRAETVFEIESLTYRDDDAVADSALFRLVRGGLRAVTGLIGKRNADRFKIRTAVATIGIRGTGFDAQCVDGCGAEGASRGNGRGGRSGGLPPGLVVSPWQDTVYLGLQNGQEVDVPESRVFFVSSETGEAEELPGMPFEVEEPRPNDVEVEDFGAAESEVVERGGVGGAQGDSGSGSSGRANDLDEGKSGLYLACIDGTGCSMDGELIGAGETLYTGGDGVVVKAEYTPAFIVEDGYFKTLDVDPTVMDLMFDPATGGGGAECSVQ